MPVVRTTTITTSFSAVGAGDELTIRGRGAAFVAGTFVGTLVLECLPPGAPGFVPVLADPATGAMVQLTAPGTLAIDEPREGTAYRWRCSAFTSGSIVAGLSAA
jgi:hypothetical protein